MRCESLLCRELLLPRYRRHGLYLMCRWILLAIDWYACFCESESGEWVCMRFKVRCEGRLRVEIIRAVSARRRIAPSQ
jgi:hypothetical protein